MKTVTFLSLFILFILSNGCQPISTKTTDSNEIPELLMRPNVIGPEEEMGFMLDQYNALVGKIKSNPADLESRLSLAELFMLEARISGEHGHYYPAALQVINEVLQQELKEPVAYRALLDKASVLLSLHQFKEAQLIGEKALSLNSHSADIYGVLVDAHVELGQYDKAIIYADKMASIRPDLRSYSRISYLREIHGKVDESIEAMKMAVAAGYPGMEQTEWARLTLGHLYERYGAQDSAMMQYEMALFSRPNYPFAIAALANSYWTKGELKKADSLNDMAMNLIPEVGFYVSRAEWEKEKGNLEKSTAMTQEILAMIADDEKSGHKMGLELSRVYLLLADNPDKALISALEEYKTRPQNIDVNRMLAEIYYEQGNLEKVKYHLTAALRTGSLDPEIKCLEGILLTKTNHIEQGRKLIQSVLVENPNLDCRFCKDARAIVL